jgi:low temperature requirement protein LtrA
MALQMSGAIKRELSWATLGVVSSQYLCFFMAWLDFATYVSRFPTNDLVYKCFEVAWMAGMLCMALFVDTAANFDAIRVGFAVGRIITVLTSIALYCLASTVLPRVRGSTLMLSGGGVAQIALLLASIFVTSTVGSAVLWAASFAVFHIFVTFSFMPMKLFGHPIGVPIDVAHMAERYGLLIMIVLGESILGQVLADRIATAEFLVHVLFGLTIAFMVHVRSSKSQYVWVAVWTFMHALSLCTACGPRAMMYVVVGLHLLLLCGRCFVVRFR